MWTIINKFIGLKPRPKKVEAQEGGGPRRWRPNSTPFFCFISFALKIPNKTKDDISPSKLFARPYHLKAPKQNIKIYNKI